MINLKHIEIRNFMGIEKFRVDIDDVGQGSLVFILGHNGAGKSSILEAIMYALTSQVDRFAGKSGILRQGADSGYVEVQFYGADGNLYQVRRSFSIGKSTLNTRSQIRVKHGKLWQRLENVPDKDKAVTAAVENILGIEGKMAEVLRSTFLIMQGKIDDMVVGKKPVETLSQSGVVPFKEEDIKQVIKEKLDNLRTRKEALDDAIISDKNLIYETYSKVAPFIEHYDSVLSARWEDIYDSDNNVMLLKLLEDTITVVSQAKTMLSQYMPSFDAVKELKNLMEQIEEAHASIEDIKSQIETLKKKKTSLVEHIERQKAYLADMGITPQSQEGLKYIAYLRDKGLSANDVAVLSHMTPVDIDDYSEAYESLQKYKKARKKQDRIFRTYAYLHGRYSDASEETLSHTKALVDKKKLLISRRDALERDINSLKSKLTSLEKDVTLYRGKVEEYENKKQDLEDAYKAVEPLLPYISLLQNLVHIEKEIEQVKKQRDAITVPDIDVLYQKRSEYEKKQESITRIIAQLEMLPESTGEKTDTEIIEQWVVDYGRYMHARDGVCPVCGAAHDVPQTSRPSVSDELISALSGMQASEIALKRKKLLDMLKKVCPNSTSVSDAKHRVAKMLEDIQQQIDSAQSVLKKREALDERLVHLQQERAELLQQIHIPLPQEITASFVEHIMNTEETYKNVLAELRMASRILKEKLAQYNDVKAELDTKERELGDVLSQLENIPNDIEQILEELMVYNHLRDYERLLLKDDISPGTYYSGFETDAKMLVAYKLTSRRIIDMLGRDYLQMREMKPPTPEELMEVNEYIAGIKSHSASLVYQKQFIEIYEHVDDLIESLSKLVQDEETLQLVGNDISTLKGHLEELVGRLQDMEKKKQTLISLGEKIPPELERAVSDSGMSPEVVLDRLEESYSSMKSLHGRLEKHIDDMEHVGKQIVLLEYIRRQVVPRFYKWYVDMVMRVFRNRLSDNLEMLSGRYRLESMQGDKGIEVYDMWNETIRPASMLSGGEKTMLGLSFVFALADVVAGYGGHRVFFIDEGFSSLDSQRKQELRPVLENLVSSSGHTIFIITHDESILDSAPPESPVIRMEKGKMVGGISTVGSLLGTSFINDNEDTDVDDIGDLLA